MLIAGPAFPQEVGRLFFTPEQRAALDARRKARVPDKPAAAVVVSPTTRVDGYVQRSDRALHGVGERRGAARRHGRGAAHRAPRGRPVPLGEGGRRATLRPGEVLDRGTGEVRDVIGEGGRVESGARRSPARK